MDTIFIFFQHIVPQHLLSRCTGFLAELRQPIWLKNWAIGLFMRHFGVNMNEAEEPDHERYANFNEFFTRPLKEGVRPIADADIVCPADGAISQLGDIREGLCFQAKGKYFSTEELLAGDEARAARFAGGRFATIYLSPRDYHRVHMPVSGRLSATSYIPGKLFSVNGTTADNVDRLFARNERLVCYFETERGPPPPKHPLVTDYREPPAPVELDKGQEMGRFKLGSTVILLFPKDSMAWDEGYGADSPTRLGESLGSYL
jgi:phosphatidylserine decarboxylase